MKKRLTGLLALTLALVMMFVPMTAQAQEGKSAYLRVSGANDVEVLSEETAKNKYSSDLGTEFYVKKDMTLNDIAVDVPDGYSISGWKLWAINDCGMLTGESEALDTAITEENLENAYGDYGYGDPLLEVILTADSTDGIDSTEEAAGSGHVHAYEWNTWREPTEMQDGMEAYSCTYCGDVQEIKTLSSFMYWNRKVQAQIKNAAPGAAVAVETPLWISFYEDILKALDERPDVSLTCKFKVKGEWYSFTIPARQAGTKLAQDGVAWYGFLYLSGIWGIAEAE